VEVGFLITLLALLGAVGYAVFARRRLSGN
jgi:hypothetical protein